MITLQDKADWLVDYGLLSRSGNSSDGVLQYLQWFPMEDKNNGYFEASGNTLDEAYSRLYDKIKNALFHECVRIR